MGGSETVDLLIEGVPVYGTGNVNRCRGRRVAGVSEGAGKYAGQGARVLHRDVDDAGSVGRRNGLDLRSAVDRDAGCRHTPEQDEGTDQEIRAIDRYRGTSRRRAIIG